MALAIVKSIAGEVKKLQLYVSLPGLHLSNEGLCDAAGEMACNPVNEFDEMNMMIGLIRDGADPPAERSVASGTPSTGARLLKSDDEVRADSLYAHGSTESVEMSDRVHLFVGAPRCTRSCRPSGTIGRA